MIVSILLTSCPGTPTDLWKTFHPFVGRMALIGCVTQTSNDAIGSLYNDKIRLERGDGVDQFRFLGNVPPTPPLSQH